MTVTVVLIQSGRIRFGEGVRTHLCVGGGGVGGGGGGSTPQGGYTYSRPYELFGPNLRRSKWTNERTETGWSIYVGAPGDDDGGPPPSNRGSVVRVDPLPTAGTVASHQKISHTEGDFGTLATTTSLDPPGNMGDLNGDGWSIGRAGGAVTVATCTWG